MKNEDPESSDDELESKEGRKTFDDPPDWIKRINLEDKQIVHYMDS